MTPAVLDFPALRTITGYKTQPAVERCLKDQGIRYFYSRTGVWTTLDLINAAGGIKQAANADTYQPGDIF
jgi:hypothetical protein